MRRNAVSSVWMTRTATVRLADAAVPAVEGASATMPAQTWTQV